MATSGVEVLDERRRGQVREERALLDELRVLLSGFYIVPLYHAQEQWTAHWTRIARPSTLPRYASPLFNVTLDMWWRRQP